MVWWCALGFRSFSVLLGDNNNNNMHAIREQRDCDDDRRGPASWQLQTTSASQKADQFGGHGGLPKLSGLTVAVVVARDPSRKRLNANLIIVTTSEDSAMCSFRRCSDWAVRAKQCRSAPPTIAVQVTSDYRCGLWSRMGIMQRRVSCDVWDARKRGGFSGCDVCRFAATVPVGFCSFPRPVAGWPEDARRKVRLGSEDATTRIFLPSTRCSSRVSSSQMIHLLNRSQISHLLCIYLISSRVSPFLQN